MELSLFDYEPEDDKTTGGPYKIDIKEVPEEVRCLDDVKEFLAEDGRVTRLRESGDFRSEESQKLLEQADIVCTNPPFSLFGEYIAQLMEYNKHFIVIGNLNAITCRDIFPLIKENKLWLGVTCFNGGATYFMANPENYEPEKMSNPKHAYVKNDRLYWRVNGVRWFTNLEHKKRKEELILYRNYTPEMYPHYDNYNAIEVSKVADIPCDYEGICGVPVSFIDKYNPNQFEILGNEIDLNIPKGRGYINGKRMYSRIFIRRKIK